jgi:hypothetical protein
MNNEKLELARIFEQIAKILKIKGENNEKLNQEKLLPTLTLASQF